MQTERHRDVEEHGGETGCWNRIGVWGDRSCPELEDAVHCHNCPVYAAAGRGLLDREAPVEYLDEWADAITKQVESEEAGRESAVLFRLADEWFGLPVHLCREVVEDRPVHTLPHRSDPVFLGLVNVRGQLQLCVSLANFLSLEQGEVDQSVSHIVYRRMIVAERDGDCWVFPADEIFGLQTALAEQLVEAPVTVSKSASGFTRSLFTWGDHNVALLDDESLFAALKRRVL